MTEAPVGEAAAAATQLRSASVKLASFVDAVGTESVGFVSDDGAQLQDLRPVLGDSLGEGFGLVDVIAAWDAAVPLLEQLAASDRDAPSAPLVGVADIRLLAPLPHLRRNVFCVGRNYRYHIAEVAAAGHGSAAEPEVPVFFTKAPSTVIGNDDPIPTHPGVTSQLDYEGELAVIIGRRGRGIALADAWDHVWGYTIFDDVTARDRQAAHRQWFLGKSLDGFGPMGPWAVTADELPAVRTGTEGGRGASIETRVNGEVRQSAETSEMIFDVPTVVSELSAGITLQPGDVIATGTPAGVGAGYNPPRFLRPGDVVEIEIAGIGTLRNPVGTS